MKRKLQVLGEYVGHLSIGAAMFTALLVFGGALNKLVHVVGPIVGDPLFEELMQAVERVILYADIAFIVWWSLYSTYLAIKELSHE